MSHSYPSTMDREQFEEINERETDPLTGHILGAAMDVHRALGSGLLESAKGSLVKQI